MLNNRKIACESDRTHIDEIVAKYSVPGFLDESEIRILYRFDRTYTALYSEEDAENIARIKQAYNEHIADTDKYVEVLFSKACAERMLFYESLVNEFKSADTKSELIRIKNSFLQLDDFMDSKKYVVACQERIDALIEINPNLVSNNEKNYINIKAKRKKFYFSIFIVNVVLLLILALMVVLSDLRIVHMYDKALNLMKDLNYAEAIEAFEDLNGYEDSSELLVKCHYCYGKQLLSSNLYKEALGEFLNCRCYTESLNYINDIVNSDEYWSSLEIGDMSYFYEKEWKVLDKKDDKVLIIMNDYICCNSDSTYSAICNNDLHDLFSDYSFEEKSRVMYTRVSLDLETGESVHFNRQIFLLNEDEINLYMPTPSDREFICEWMLLSSASDPTYVDCNGDIIHSSIEEDYYKVRPAMWIGINENAMNNKYSEIINDSEQDEEVNRLKCICQDNVSCSNYEELLEENYNYAVECYKNKQYDEAMEIFSLLDGYSNSEAYIEGYNQILREEDFRKASDYIDNGHYAEAIELLASNIDYVDNMNVITYILNETDYLSSSNIGDVIYLGVYDNELIRWRVLDKNDNSIFLISQDCICSQAFDYSNSDVTWENCSIRSWLNNEFVDSAFSEAFRERIVQTYIDDATYDKLFLLSENEVNNYLENIIKDSTEPSIWWLRDKWICDKPNVSLHTTCYTDGDNYRIGNSSDENEWGVRPVMWLSVE